MNYIHYVVALLNNFSLIGNKELLDSRSIYVLASQFYTSYTSAILSTFIPYFCASGIAILVRYSDAITPLILDIIERNTGTCMILYDKLTTIPSSGTIVKLLEKNACCLVIPKHAWLKDNKPVIELLATLYTGILITESVSAKEFNYSVSCTLDANKELFVIPGTIYTKTSQGTNYLIRRGATLIQRPSEVNFD